MTSIVVQFKSDLGEVLGPPITDPENEPFELYPSTWNEIEWRQEREKELDAVMKDNLLGWCDGGGTGLGSMDIFLELYDLSRLEEAMQVIVDDLTDRELIQWATVGSSTNGQLTQFYPVEAA